MRRAPGVDAARAAACALAGVFVLLAAAAPASAQIILLESRLPGMPELAPATYDILAKALDELKGVKIVPLSAIKAGVATATPSLHLVDTARLKTLRDKVTAAYALAGGADPARAIDIARETAVPLLLAVVAGADADVRAVYFAGTAALAEAYRTLGRTSDAQSALRDAALYASEYEVTPDLYPPALVDLYGRAKAELASAKGALDVSASSASAEVVIDGISAGTGSFRGDLARGEHYAFARDGSLSSALMRFTLGSGGTTLKLELVDPDLPKFGPHPYVRFASVSERAVKEPEIAVTLVRRGGATGAAFVSHEGANIEVRVYDAAGRPMATGSARPKSGPIGELASKLHPYLPRISKGGAAGAAVATTPKPPGGTGRVDTGPRGSGTGRPPPPPPSGTEDPTGPARPASKSPLFLGGVGAFGGGLLFTIVFAAVSQSIEAQVRARFGDSGFFDYDHRLRLASTGRAMNALAVLSVLIAIAGGTTAGIILATSGSKKAKPSPSEGYDGPHATLRLLPDGIVLEF